MGKKGFTLVELLIAMVVGLIIVAAIYGMMNLGQRSSASVDRKVLTQQDVRAVLDLMAMEIRMASFNPNVNGTMWGTTPSGGCSSLAFTQQKKGIQIATPTSILVAMDLGSSVSPDFAPDGVIGSASNECIRYDYNSAAGTITRIVDCTQTDIILGGTGSSTNVVNDAATPVFQYFIPTKVLPLTDAELLLPTNIGAIRRIRITIVADVKTQGSIQVNRRTYSTDVLVRNHVLSP